MLVIRGEAGVGKTALLHYCARQAAGFRVARIAGRRVRDGAAVRGPASAVRADARPARRAAGAAAGRAAASRSACPPAPPPDRFLVALAALSLLAEVAAERPLLCLVDDAQWLDAASGQVLGFVARRLLAESVAIVFAVRDPADERSWSGLPELRARRARRTTTRARCWRRSSPGRLDERVRDRIVAETRGNPLAILELPRGLAATQLPGGLALQADAAAGPDRGELPAAARALPDETRRLLLLAAAEPVGDPLLVWRAAERLGIGLVGGGRRRRRTACWRSASG